MQSLESSPGHQITKSASGLITGFHWSLDGKTMAVLRTHSTSDVVALRKVVNSPARLGSNPRSGCYRTNPRFALEVDFNHPEV